jgi:hypothetical protein
MLVSELALVGIALGGMFNVVRLVIGTQLKDLRRSAPLPVYRNALETQLIGTRYILTVAS